MPKIYDNIENHLNEGLAEVIKLSKRTDFCVGYFNLRGWKEVADIIDNLSGEIINEDGVRQNRYCRLLIGMQTQAKETIKEF